MHVAIATPAFPAPRSGRNTGIERLSRELCDGLTSRGIDVTIVTTFWNGGSSEDHYGGARILRVDDTSTTFGRWGALGDSHYWSWGFRVGRLLRDRVRPDVLHGLTPVASTPALREAHVPVVTSFHHPDPIWGLQDLFHRPFHRLLESRAYLASTLMTAPSRASARALQQIFGIPEERIRILYWGVDETRFSLGPIRTTHETNLLYIGNHERRKGLDYLLEAVSLLRRNGVPVRLTTVGGGRQLPDLKRQAEKLALSDAVRFLGYVPDSTDDRLSQLYSEADLFVFPSLMEGFGFVLVEAMASGIPVIASRISAIPEVVDDAGVLVSAKDPVGLARAIENLAKDPQKRLELRERGRDRVVRYFTWDKVIPKLISTYEEAIDLNSGQGLG